MSKKLFLPLFTSLLLYFSVHHVYSQQCGTDQRFEEWKLATPNWHDPIAESTTNQQTERRSGKIIIPVVFHIINTNGPENISNEQVFDAIRILNEDFNKLNADTQNVRNNANAPFKPLIADMEIEFQLAKKDPQGNCTNGINRITSSLHIDAGDNVKSLIKWPVNRYLNIWVVSSIYSGNGSGIILGYSNFPFMSASTDGIVMRSDAVGSFGAANPLYQRALTHEVGHYLGLYHTFQGGCNESQGGDLVADTPPVSAQFSNSGCNPTNKSCANNQYYDQWENFMDYSHGCQSMFSIGQKNRVYGFLQSNDYTRKNLYSNENLEFTGILPKAGEKPFAFFESDIQIVCAGSPVQFMDNSCNGLVSQRTWEFEGGNIQSSNQPSPIIIYDEPGEYNVKLTTTNSVGSSSYEIKKYIKVLPKVAALTGIAESFETNNSFSLEGITQLTGTGFDTFAKANVGFYGNNSIKANITNSNTGTRFVLETPSMNISKMAGMNPKISFMVGYGRRNSTAIDYIRIYVSEDCGSTWKQKVQRLSAQFSSSVGFVSNFTPSNQNEWKRINFSLSEFETSTSIKIRIEIVSGGGNPIFIDDINISQYFTSISDIELDALINIHPNPSTDLFNIHLNPLFLNKETSITLFDMSGRNIATIYDNNIAEKDLIQNIDLRSKGIKPGIYFLKFETNEGIFTKRLIFAD
ncbi:MAG: M43 family zinc metalloprotease [Bacteroidia bacterium]|nr:M43 family zinc metalloprotease [Bacteroidia bacterium]